MVGRNHVGHIIVWRLDRLPRNFGAVAENDPRGLKPTEHRGPSGSSSQRLFCALPLSSPHRILTAGKLHEHTMFDLDGAQHPRLSRRLERKHETLHLDQNRRPNPRISRPIDRPR